MTGWILILALSGSTGQAMTTAHYTTEAACKAAGEAATKLLTMSTIRYTCTAR